MEVFIGDDPADKHLYLRLAIHLQQFHNAWSERHVRTGKNRKTDNIHILLEGSFSDHFRRLAQTSIDDLHAGVTQSTGDHFCTAVMSIETRFGNQYAYFLFGHGSSNKDLLTRLYYVSQSTYLIKMKGL